MAVDTENANTYQVIDNTYQLTGPNTYDMGGANPLPDDYIAPLQLDIKVSAKVKGIRGSSRKCL